MTTKTNSAGLAVEVAAAEVEVEVVPLMEFEGKPEDDAAEDGLLMEALVVELSFVVEVAVVDELQPPSKVHVTELRSLESELLAELVMELRLLPVGPAMSVLQPPIRVHTAELTPVPTGPTGVVTPVPTGPTAEVMPVPSCRGAKLAEAVDASSASTETIELDFMFAG